MGRADVIRTICDLAPAPAMSASRWAAIVERAADRVLEGCVDLDPVDDRARRRAGDGRSVWIEPTATQFTSTAIVAQETDVICWAMDRQGDDPAPSTSVVVDGLDVMQADAAAAVAGWDRLVLVQGPAGAGKTTMLERAVDDLDAAGRPVFGRRPHRESGPCPGNRDGDGERHDRQAAPRTPTQRPGTRSTTTGCLPGTTVIVDEAGMIGTPTLHQLAGLADRHDWRMVARR